ncbi:MAG: hypothetical protein A2070_08120 [Bdellovibrionales bacterium GWC1_52_8]|nr:MAG: hypothetical protein A2Z97_10460 [Bdellovibrionales bacterium GWB1_52_6]OFZ06145.1 MAG: hypothetical protein A2X97_01580 [Bdellovibrionales bacterium GWA1_52_35]OFZ33071.1 MAG: hypothetical protein A2070_08120 [Bdellovibrionales bacterium GWC1_52_8]
MANTRQSTKRAKQANKRNLNNQTVRSAARSALTAAVNTLKTKDVEKTKAAYLAAVKTLSKAASKGAMPKARAARKISRLTLLAKKMLPASVQK